MKSITDAGIDDLSIIHDLAHEIWPYAYGDILSPGQLKYMLEQIYSIASLQNQFVSLRHHFIIALDKNIPVGFASFSPKEKNRSVFRLHKIYILPKQKGKGTGKFILNYIINSVKKSGGNILELNVNRDNKALHFYESQGFKIVSEEDIDIGEGYFMNDYVMQKILG